MIAKYLYFLFIHLALLLPGLVIVRRFATFSKRSPGIILSTAYCVSLAIFGTVVLLAYALHIDFMYIRVLAWSLLIASAIVALRTKLWQEWRDYLFPVASCVVLSLFSLVVIGLTFNAPLDIIPDPDPLPNRNYDTLAVKVLNVSQTVANDNYIPYRQAQFIVNRSDPARDSFINEWGVHFFQRTPLMGAITAYFYIMLGDKPPIDYTWSAVTFDGDGTYKKFQIISHILNGLFVVPAFYLLSRFFNIKTAAISTLFFTISPFFIYNAFFSWPKTLVSFFILASWLLLFEKKTRYTVIAGIIAGYAFLAHDLAVLYVGATCFALLFAKRYKDMLVYGLMPLLFVVPWMIVAKLIYDKPSSFIYYPFSIRGIPPYEKRNEVIAEFFQTSPFKIVQMKIDFIYYLFTPYQLIALQPGRSIALRLWAVGVFSVPGALGLGLMAPLGFGIYSAIRRKLVPLQFWLYITLPVLLCILIIGWPRGVGAMHFAQAVVVLLTGLAVAYLVRLRSKLWLVVAFMANAIYLGYFIAYSYKFDVGGWLQNATDIISLAVLLAVTLAYGYAAYWIAKSKPPELRKILT